MNSSYVGIGSSFSKVMKLIFKNKLAIHPRYLLRLFILLQGTLWTSTFGRVEKIKYKKKIASTPLPQKPVFIIGHWRTGSTFLHQLIHLDSNFTTPTVFQVTVPNCYISIEKYYKPFMKKMMHDKRPMDNVKFGPDAPQEDEFALLRLTLNSPLENMIFPMKEDYFLNNRPELLTDTSKTKEWAEALTYFYKKLAFTSGKRLLIKNPFHSMRIKLLKSIFPDAVFIHIYRHPYNVVPSTIRMWDIIARQNCLNNNWKKPTVKETAIHLRQMLQKIKSDLTETSKRQYTEVCYETLEKAPVETVKNIYQELDISFSKAFEESLNAFVEEEKGFIKNKYNLTTEDKRIIDAELAAFMAEKKYA